MKKLLLVGLLSLFIFFSVEQAEAKVLPQAKGAGKSTVRTTTGGGGSLTVSPKMRADRRALVVYFNNLQSTKTVSYTLIYTTNGQQEGAGGTVSATGNSTSRELLFGTCSKNVCRYHTNIKNARLEVSYTSSSGKKYLKRYKIKV